MKKLLLCAASLLFFSATNLFAEDSPKTNPSENSEVIKLFNGKNLDNWYTYLRDRGKNVDPNGVFTVKDGLLRISGEEWGCITSNEEFENYVITLRYKWGEETHGARKGVARDSGLLLHSRGEDGAQATAWMYSLEVNIYEGRTGEIINISSKEQDELASLTAIVDPKTDTEGSNWGSQYMFGGKEKVILGRGEIYWRDFDKESWPNVVGSRSPQDIEYPHGEWNTLECVVAGDKLYVILNGQLINQAKNISHSRGKIQIQSEGAEIYYSDIIIEKL
ncbi:MAG: DUF1080 domain-containing protein [Rikenellaceae bacterium]